MVCAGSIEDVGIVRFRRAPVGSKANWKAGRNQRRIVSGGPFLNAPTLFQLAKNVNSADREGGLLGVYLWLIVLYHNGVGK